MERVTPDARVSSLALIHSLQFQAVVVVVVIGCSIFYGLGAYPLLDNNEGMYAEIARELLHNGDFVIPHLNGLPYIEKPPLLYWLTAACFQVFGISEYSARLVPAIAAFLSCLSLWWFFRILQYPLAAIIAALIAGTSLGYLMLSRTLLFDMLLTALLSLSLLSFYLWWRTKKIWYLRSAYVACALAILAKGLVALVLPVVIAGIFLIYERQLKSLRTFFDPIGIGLFALITLPWHIAAQIADPDFFHNFVIGEHALRFLGERSPHDYYTGPLWYYLPRIFGMFLPWSLLAPLLFIKKTSNYNDIGMRSIERFAWIWFLVILVFFSISYAKANYYLITGIPPLAIITGLRLQSWVLYNQPRIVKTTIIFTFLYAAAPLMVGAIASHILKVPFTAFESRLIIPAIAMLLLCCLAITSAWYSHRFTTLIAIALLVVPVNIAFIKLFEDISPLISSAQAVAKIKRSAYAQSTVVSYQDFAQISSLPYYLGRPIKILDSHSSDLAYGITKDSHAHVSLTKTSFNRLVSNSAVVTVVLTHNFDKFNRSINDKNQMCLWKTVGELKLFVNDAIYCSTQHHLRPVFRSNEFSHQRHSGPGSIDS